MADIMDPAADKRPDPTYRQEQVSVALDLLFRVAAETGPAVNWAELAIDPRAYAGSGFERCARRPLGLRCEASFRQDLEAGRVYVSALAKAVAQRQTALGWTVGDWVTREGPVTWTELEARGRGHPNSVLVAKGEGDYGDGAWLTVNLTIEGEGPAP